MSAGVGRSPEIPAPDWHAAGARRRLGVFARFGEAFALIFRPCREDHGAKPIIPPRSCMTRKRAFDPTLYKLRNRIERTVGRLKQFRRIATRYDRLPETYRANLHLASIAFWC